MNKKCPLEILFSQKQLFPNLELQSNPSIKYVKKGQRKREVKRDRGEKRWGRGAGESRPGQKTGKKLTKLFM